MSRLNSDKEQQDRETEKRRKRAQLFAAIGDGLASLSNLFFTTKYAPNAYNPAYSLSEATKRRYDELQAKGDAEWRDKVRERIGDLQRKRAERIAQANAAAERAYKEREYALKQADLLRKAKADEAKNQLEQDKLRMKQDVDASTIARNNAQARYYRNGGAGAGRRGGGSGNQWNTETTTKKYDEYGNVIDSENTVDPSEYQSSSESSSSDSSSSSSSSSSGSGSGSSVVNYATQFVGNPYVWGGTSLTDGADCSGFVQSVYANFGISLPRTTWDQEYAGTGISYEEAQPGDLILYEGHVGIYMGDGQIVNAINASKGIGIIPATCMNIKTVRRVL